MSVVDRCRRHAPSNILAESVAKDDLAGSQHRIAPYQGEMDCPLHSDNLPHFNSGSTRVQVTDMQRISVAQTCAEQSLGRYRRSHKHHK